MFSHTMLGTNDLDRAEAFYDALVPALGGEKFFRTETAVYWEFGDGGFKLALTLPFDGNPACVGNGVMVAFSVGSRDVVDTLHATALAMGGTDEGIPGDRNAGIYYGAYFRDPDGNKISIYVINSPPEGESRH